MVNPDQAKIVRYVYSLFLKGTSYHAIAKQLTREGYKTATGGHSWYPSNIQYILTNEKYKGDALLQKTYTDDFLTKKAIINNGEIPQYYVSANHEAIITPDVFDLVQIEVAFRRKHTRIAAGNHLFSGRIRCGICGGFFGPKIWHSNSKYRKVVWQCNEKYKNKGTTCNSGHIAEDRIKEKFIMAINKLITDRDKIIREFEEIKDIIFDTTSQEAELEQLQEELNTTTHQLEKLTKENASTVMDQSTYKKEFENMLDTYHCMKSEVETITNTIKDKKRRKVKAKHFLSTLKEQDTLISTFSEKLWFSLLDHVVVYGKEDVRFTFKNGEEIK